MGSRETVWHDDAWFAERGFPRPITSWERQQDEATLYEIYESIRNAPPFDARQQAALRRVIGAIRAQMAERTRDNPGELECSCTYGCTVLAAEKWRRGAIVA